MLLSSTRKDWLGNIRGDVLAGIVVALALIPEAIAFSIIAGVDPKVGLYAAFSIAVIIAFVGGRPGMITGVECGQRRRVGTTFIYSHGLWFAVVANSLALSCNSIPFSGQ